MKLTLNINEEIIKEIKIYAKNHGISVSKLIENYLTSILKKEKPDLGKYSGIFGSIPLNISDEEVEQLKQERLNELRKKHL